MGRWAHAHPLHGRLKSPFLRHLPFTDAYRCVRGSRARTTGKMPQRTAANMSMPSSREPIRCDSAQETSSLSALFAFLGDQGTACLPAKLPATLEYDIGFATKRWPEGLVPGEKKQRAARWCAARHQPRGVQIRNHGGRQGICDIYIGECQRAEALLAYE